MANVKPLVVDADGALLTTELNAECFWGALGRDPMAVARALPDWRNRPVFQAKLAEAAQLRADLLPINANVQKLIDASRAGGRDVHLLSSFAPKVVSDLSRAHGFGDAVVVPQNTGPARAEAVGKAHGDTGYDFCGARSAPRELWDGAENAYIVGEGAGLTKKLAAGGHSVTRLRGGWQARDLLKALRPHQWVKNVLLLVPMVAAHAFDFATLALVLLGMIAYSFAASSIYIVNDLLDLEADRLHPTKRKRPFASGKVPLKIGMLTCLVLILAALLIGLVLGWAYFAVIAVYIVLSLAYSLRLKRLRWIDIATLAALYSLRVVAGAAAAQVAVSVFLLIFIFPVFLTLGCVKRITEVTRAKTDERLPGRGYGRLDREDLLNVAVLGGLGALVTFFLYSISDQAVSLYPDRWLLWVAMVPLGFWLLRMIRYGYTGRQDYDPIVFAMRDLRGIGLVFFMLALMFYAAGLWRPLFGL